MSPDIDPVIRVRNLGKRYRLQHNAPYRTLGETITNVFSGKNRGRAKTEPFWALKDVSFDVNEGEVVGIIGRNGAGKSTLLKILSRITTPTEGMVEVRGRVGSLLEVGTGFHPELTGRENIFLSGSILGMQKKEIEAKFDEIVNFSEIEKFLDTPVKRYSSGMYVRLAFAVAAHLEPEILLIDEVLAVGDAAFQKKCLGKMDEVARAGRTILFVSHNLAAVSNLCERSVLLDSGKLIVYEETTQVIERYLKLTVAGNLISLRNRMDRKGDGRLRFTDTWVENDRGERVSVVRTGDNITIVALYELSANESIPNLSVGFALSNIMYQLTDLGNESSGQIFGTEIPGTGRIECVLPKIPLNSGTYYYNVIARSNNGIEDWVLKAGEFSVESSDFYGTGKVVDPNQGAFLLTQQWALIDMKKQGKPQ